MILGAVATRAALASHEFEELMRREVAYFVPPHYDSLSGASMRSVTVIESPFLLALAGWNV